MYDTPLKNQVKIPEKGLKNQERKQRPKAPELKAVMWRLSPSLSEETLVLLKKKTSPKKKKTPFVMPKRKKKKKPVLDPEPKKKKKPVLDPELERNIRELMREEGYTPAEIELAIKQRIIQAKAYAQMAKWNK
jgi:hypothetical protein